MPDLTTLSPLALCAFTVLVAGGGSFLPVSPTEPALMAIAAVAPPWLLMPLTILATLSSMGAKTVIYFGGRAATRMLPPKYLDKVEATSARLTGRAWLRWLVLVVSAATGIPPFYMVTVLSGSLRIPLFDFLVAGTVGRAIRFGTLIFIPYAVTRWA